MYSLEDNIPLGCFLLFVGLSSVLRIEGVPSMQDSKKLMPFTLKHILGSSLIAALAFVSLGLYDGALQKNWAEEQIAGELQAAAQAQVQCLGANLSRLWRTVEMLADVASDHPADLQQWLIEARRFNPALTLLGLAKVDGPLPLPPTGMRPLLRKRPGSQVL